MVLRRFINPREIKARFVVALKFIWKYPLRSAMMGAFITSPLLDRWLRHRAHNQLYGPVYQKFLTGSRPLNEDRYKGMKVVDRETVFEMIKTELFPEPVNHNKGTHFGVIIGPSGSGKSCAVQKTCHENHEGVLYFEIVNADTFVAELCSIVGMKTSLATLRFSIGIHF